MTDDLDRMFLDSPKRELNMQDCHGQFAAVLLDCDGTQECAGLSTRG